MRKLAAITSLSLLSGCYSLQGPPQAINARGVAITGYESVVQSSGPHSKPSTGPTDPERVASLQKRFTDAARAAEHGDSAAFTSFRNAGFSLVYANCNDFFWSMGRQQTKAHILRDSVAPVITLLTGIVALHDFTSHPGRKEDILQGLALGSGFVLAGVDIYQANFLFGADNIDSVRELTLQALSVHAREASANDARSFDEAVIHIIDNQAICTPSHILSLARAAIDAGTVVPAASNVPKTLPQVADEQELRTLGGIVQMPFGRLTPDQAGALWAVLSGEANDLYPLLYPKLSALGNLNPIVETAGAGGGSPTYTPNTTSWTPALISAALDSFAKLSINTKAGFRQVLEAARKDKAIGEFVLSTPSGEFNHVKVTVKKETVN